MVSFDVESLFTNIPLDECIDLAVHYITTGNPGIKLSAFELKRLFTFATAKTHFLFKGTFYDQVDGVAMGFPLAPVLANLFMGHHEKMWLEQYKESEILFYRRYVDDTFCLFHSEHDAILFFNVINNQHPNIHFTMEKEINHVLPFLDVLLDNKAPHFPVTTTYRKKTFTGVLTNFLSFTPLCYKLGLVKTLIDRIFKINNTWLGFHNDIQKLFVILRKNLYPEHVLNNIIHRYISKAVKGDNARPIAGVEPQESPKFYFKIPYIGRFSGIAQHRVRTLVNRFCKPVDIKLVFSTFKIKNLFNVKDSLPDRLRTRVVYKFSCASCNACYIGETSRHFTTRVREHLSSDRSSHVFKHLHSSESCRISCSVDCFTVLDSATTKFQVKLKESMYIKWEKPDLNQQVKHINLTLSL